MTDPNADPTPPRRPRPTGPVQYRGDDLTPERGPGLGCFRFQLVVLVVFIILTPLTRGLELAVRDQRGPALRGDPACCW